MLSLEFPFDTDVGMENMRFYLLFAVAAGKEGLLEEGDDVFQDEELLDVANERRLSSPRRILLTVAMEIEFQFFEGTADFSGNGEELSQSCTAILLKRLAVLNLFQVIDEDLLGQFAVLDLSHKESTSAKMILARDSSSSYFSSSRILPSTSTILTIPRRAEDGARSTNLSRGFASGAAGKVGISFMICMKFCSANSIWSSFSMRVREETAALYRRGAY